MWFFYSYTWTLVRDTDFYQIEWKKTSKLSNTLASIIQKFNFIWRFSTISGIAPPLLRTMKIIQPVQHSLQHRNNTRLFRH